VHNGSEEAAEAIFARYGLGDVPRVADPDGALYQAFGLARGTARQLASPEVWLRGARAWLAGNRPGTAAGDTRQLPGVFLVVDGRVVKAFRHELASDRPDYGELATSPIGPTG
jgi:hypothetical protein